MIANPKPGSPEAVEAGCTCPIIDNGHGAGYMGGQTDPETGETMFWINGGCPLHGVKAGES